MEYTNENTIEFVKEGNIFKRHKFITVLIAFVSISTIINIFLIYKFFEVLFLAM